MPEAYGFDLKARTVTYMDDGNTKINTSTWPQCGRAVAALFSLPVLPKDKKDKNSCLSQWRNKEVHSSSFLISQRDMLASVLRVTGDKESDWTIKTQGSKDRWEQGIEWLQSSDKRMQGYLQRMYSRVFFQDGCGNFTSKLDNKVLGLPEESLDDFTKEGIRMVENGWSYW